MVISFINAIFEGRVRITDLALENSEPARRFEGPEAGVFDLACTTEDGEKLFVGMVDERGGIDALFVTKGFLAFI